MRRGRLAMLVAAVCSAAATAAVLSLTGASGTQPAGADYLPGSYRAGTGGLSQIPVATCRQWKRGSYRQRIRVVDQLGDHFEQPSRFYAGARLGDDDAYDILDAACARREAANFRLYKVYARALAFEPYAER